MLRILFQEWFQTPDQNWKRILKALYDSLEAADPLNRTYDEDSNIFLYVNEEFDLGRNPTDAEIERAIMEYGEAQRTSIAKSTGIAKKDVRNLLIDLEILDLIDRPEGGPMAPIVLTEKGFDVAHQVEIEKSRQRLNKYLVLFTFFLVFATFANVVPELFGL